MSFSAPAFLRPTRYRRYRRLALLLLIVLAGCASGGRGDWRRGERPFFEAEVLTGLGEDGQAVATLSVSIPFRNLIFFRSDDGFVSTYRIRAVQIDARGRQRLRQWTGRARAEDYDETRSSKVARTTMSLELAELEDGSKSGDSGSSLLDVVVEIEGSSRKGRRQLPLRAQRFESGELTVAELALYRPRGPAVEVPTAREVMGRALPDPNLFQRQPDARFDVSTGEPWLFVRIFDLRSAPRDSVLDLVVRSSWVKSDSVRWSTRVEVPSQGTVTSVLLQMPRTAFVFGANRITAEVDEGSEQEVLLYDNGLDLQQTLSWEANLTTLRVIASEEEWEELEGAGVGERREVWRRFWDRRDPDSRTARNERMEEHFRRVTYARNHLEDGFRDGARSERGEVFIRHGSPDTIEQGSPSLDSFAHFEIWRYVDEGITYYFRDTSGAGHFRLVWWEEE